MFLKLGDGMIRTGSPKQLPYIQVALMIWSILLGWLVLREIDFVQRFGFIRNYKIKFVMSQYNGPQV